MEGWLESTVGDSEIKMVACPKCRPSEPNRNIMTTNRYMNRVKKTLQDIQAVKEKVYGQVQEIRKKRETLLQELEKIEPVPMDGIAGLDNEQDELLLLHTQLLQELPVVKNDRRKEIDTESLRLLSYKTDFFKAVNSVRNDVCRRINVQARLKLKTKINVLIRALNKRSKKISTSEVESFSLELNRIIRYCDLLVLWSSAEFNQLKTQPAVVMAFAKASSLANQLTRYTDDHDKRVAEAIDHFKKELKSNAQLTAEEKKMIHMAMSTSFHGRAAAQGHWFKCPNGHTYVITECGGAMQEATCPERGCGARIGGRNHAYLPGQQLASDMDGATRPAWSSGFDMRNFDLNNLH